MSMDSLVTAIEQLVSGLCYTVIACQFVVYNLIMSTMFTEQINNIIVLID